MMRVIATICELSAPETCEVLVHDFKPRLPIVCVFAAGPELARITPEGWAVARWRCAEVSEQANTMSPGQDR